MKRIDTIATTWEEYAVLDSGDGRRLEYIAGIIVDRPDPQAVWQKKYPKQWLEAQGQFLWADKGERWKFVEGISDTWNIHRGSLTLELAAKGFKHIGIFPEHAQQWDLIASLGSKHKELRMLNLFGYTGAVSIVAAQTGIHVTHVDASKTTIETVKKNIIQSGLSSDAIRVICEDALRYAKRLVQRGEQFEVIVMDPPAFGRGPKGEVWKIEESLRELLSLLPVLLSSHAKLVILNGYTAGYSARTFGELLAEVLPQGTIVYGDIALPEQHSSRCLSTGIYAQWTA